MTSKKFFDEDLWLTESLLPHPLVRNYPNYQMLNQKCRQSSPHQRGTAEMSLAKPKRGEPDEALGAGGGGRREEGGEGETKRLRKLSAKRWTARDCRRQRRQSGKNVASFALVIAGLLSGTREVLGADYVDRGEVSMDCDECSCTGPSDDGDITVFVNPSSGERVRVGSGESKIVALLLLALLGVLLGSLSGTSI